MITNSIKSIFDAAVVLFSNESKYGKVKKFFVLSVLLEIVSKNKKMFYNSARYITVDSWRVSWQSEGVLKSDG